MKKKLHSYKPCTLHKRFPSAEGGILQPINIVTPSQMHDQAVLRGTLLPTQLAHGHGGAVLGLDVVEHAALVRGGEATRHAHAAVGACAHHQSQQALYKQKGRRECDCNMNIEHQN